MSNTPLSPLVWLATYQVDWTDEQACFDTFLRELAFFYVPVPTSSASYDSTTNAKPDLSTSETAEKKHGTSLKSLLFLPAPFPPSYADLTSHLAFVLSSWRPELYQLEHLIFPAIRKHLMPPRSLLTEGDVVQMANLPDLYRVFERC